MLKAEDFQLPIDREFTLIKIKQEIDECNDKQALRDNLKQLIHQNAQFQHLISKLLEAELHRSLSDFASFIEEETDAARRNEPTGN
tara:strand:- start:1079 stop:1336 length:258 start_codon:yes stop_codon:yes gene_type:complete